MLIVAMILVVAETVITFYVMRYLIEFFLSIPVKWIQQQMIKMFLSPLISFGINYMISTIIASFVGVGLMSGYANLVSSIICSVGITYMLKRKLKVCTTKKLI